jgi:hypothetical protein
MGLLGWLVTFVIALPFLAAWLLVKLVVLLIQFAVDMHQRAHAAPVIPNRLKPPSRQ